MIHIPKLIYGNVEDYSIIYTASPPFPPTTLYTHTCMHTLIPGETFQGTQQRIAQMEARRVGIAHRAAHAHAARGACPEDGMCLAFEIRFCLRGHRNHASYESGAKLCERFTYHVDLYMYRRGIKSRNATPQMDEPRLLSRPRQCQ